MSLCQRERHEKFFLARLATKQVILYFYNSTSCEMQDKNENYCPEIERPQKPEKTVKTEGQGQGGAGLSFLGLGVSQGVVPRVPGQTGRGGLGHEQAYWIPQYTPWFRPYLKTSLSYLTQQRNIMHTCKTTKLDGAVKNHAVNQDHFGPTTRYYIVQ